MWDDSKGACVPECNKHEAGEKCSGLLGCKFVVEDDFGMCENVKTDKLIKKHAVKEGKKDKKNAKFLLKRCKTTKKAFCKGGRIAVRTCGMNGSQKEGLTCTRSTGLLKFLSPDDPRKEAGKCSSASLHINSCVAEMEN